MVPYHISILAPRGGSDHKDWEILHPPQVFQSSLPAGGATESFSGFSNTFVISILAPRGGSDSFWDLVMLFVIYFNPRSPRGERLLSFVMSSSVMNFNPRSPRGERHANHYYISAFPQFQSSLPAGGATPAGDDTDASFTVFQSSLPAGGATKPIRLLEWG